MNYTDISDGQSGNEYRTQADTRLLPNLDSREILEKLLNEEYHIIPVTHYSAETDRAVEYYEDVLTPDDFDFDKYTEVCHVGDGQRDYCLVDDDGAILTTNALFPGDDEFCISAHILMQIEEYSDLGYELYALGCHPDILENSNDMLQVADGLLSHAEQDFQKVHEEYQGEYDDNGWIEEDEIISDHADFLREAYGLQKIREDYSLNTESEENYFVASVNMMKEAERNDEDFYYTSEALSAMGKDRETTIHVAIGLSTDERAFSPNANINGVFINHNAYFAEPSAEDQLAYQMEQSYKELTSEIRRSENPSNEKDKYIFYGFVAKTVEEKTEEEGSRRDDYDDYDYDDYDDYDEDLDMNEESWEPGSSNYEKVLSQGSFEEINETYYEKEFNVEPLKYPVVSLAYDLRGVGMMELASDISSLSIENYVEKYGKELQAFQAEIADNPTLTSFSKMFSEVYQTQISAKTNEREERPIDDREEKSGVNYEL